MRAWAFMLGGMIVWSVHFLGVYGLASLGDVVTAADAPVWRAAVAGLSLVCFAAAVAIMILALRARAAAPKEARFRPEIAAGSAGFGAVAILWQALPAWIGH